MPEEERRDGEGFLAAWSRRKRAVARAETQANTPDEATAEARNAPEADTDPLPAAEPEISEEELAALPAIDEITGATDLQPFLQRGVPESLRKAAMRKVWLSNALICDHDDPAVDYAWDWNAPEAVPGASGALQGDKVSKMMDDLINRNRPDKAQKDGEDAAPDSLGSEPEGDEGEEVASLDGAPEEGPEFVEAPAEPAFPTEPVRRGDQPKPQDVRSDDRSASETEEPRVQPEIPASAPMPPRRHGSAVPE